MGDVLEPSFDGSPPYTVVSAMGKCALFCGLVGGQLGCTRCCLAGDWSAATLQECLSLALSVLVDVK